MRQDLQEMASQVDCEPRLERIADGDILQMAVATLSKAQPDPPYPITGTVLLHTPV
jgi:hypothetical protein